MGVHPVFHISMLRKHMKDDNKKIIPDVAGVTVRADTSYEIEPVRLLARSTRKCLSKVTCVVKYFGMHEICRMLRGSLRTMSIESFLTFLRMRYVLCFRLHTVISSVLC